LGGSDADKETWLWLERQNLELQPGSVGQGYFSIQDMRNNERTKDLSSVVGPPFLKFYAAAPIATKLGITIGSIFVVCDSDRRELSVGEARYLGTMARACMSQLEMARDVESKRRVLKMTERIDSFVRSRESLSEMLDRRSNFRTVASHSSQQKTKTGATDAFPSALTDAQGRDIGETAMDIESSVSRGRRLYSEPHRGPISDMERSRKLSAESGTSCGRTDGDSETPYRKVFRRAAESLRISLEVDGVVFLDGFVGLHGGLLPTAEPELELKREMAQTSDEQSTRKDKADYGPTSNYSACKSTNAGSHIWTPPQERSDSEDTTDQNTRVFTSTDFKGDVYTERPAEVLGFSLSTEAELCSAENVSESTLGLAAFNEGFLQHFLERHPEGKTWYLPCRNPKKTILNSYG
jgi:hypothetical protein